MSKPIRVQLSRNKGWRMPANTVKVDRTTRWGNPFAATRDRPVAQCVALFERMWAGAFVRGSSPTTQEQRQYIAMVKRDADQLRGKNLACWCSLDNRCHADILLALANQPR